MKTDDEQLALDAANRLLNEIGVHHPEQVGIDQFLTDVHRVATVYVQSSKASEGAGDGWKFPLKIVSEFAINGQEFVVKDAQQLVSCINEALRLSATGRVMIVEESVPYAPKPPETKP